MKSFEQDLIERLADALGVPADLISADYRAQEYREITKAREFHRKLVMLDRFYAAKWHAELAKAIFAMATWDIKSYCGYDPQKLLPPPGPENRPMSLWDKETLLRMSQAVMDDVYSFSGIADLFPKPLKEGHIEFHEPTFKHYAAVVTTHHVDMGELETLLADPHIRCVIIDFDSPGGEIRPPNRQLDIYAAGTFAHLERNIYHRPPQVAPKNQPAYHRHDPTKKHRRRK